MSIDNYLSDTDESCELWKFVRAVYPGIKDTLFHRSYYRILDAFGNGRISKLIVSVPPQHGKSLGASVLLPSFILGKNPDSKIALASYNASLATRFNKRAQRIIESKSYNKIFPDTTIKPISGKNDAIRTASHVEIVGRHGELISVGREGSLTGNEVDVFILDDLYKDAMEANSPLIRENCWEWYTSVVKTRLHNDSSELIVFTRWHEEDLIGTILTKEGHVILKEWKQLEALKPGSWVVVNYEALKEGFPSEVDPRLQGEALWPEKHSVELLKEKRNLDHVRFSCMYQGQPSAKDGLLYSDRFRTYTSLPENIMKRGNYTDTADLGDDYLCSICYVMDEDKYIYITDLVYSREGMEKTEVLVSEMLNATDTRHAFIESNNGGRGFARALQKLVKLAKIDWFHQSGNKEARILSNSATVLKYIMFPEKWAIKWPEIYSHLVTYRRSYKTNRYHDAPDVLTGIIEKELANTTGKRIRKCTYGL